MAYSTGKTSALQTAIKAGTDIAIALFNAASPAEQKKFDVIAKVHELADDLKLELFAQVDADNAKTATSTPFTTQKDWDGPRKSGGNITLEDAKGLVLNFGAFKGLTIGDVITMSATEASAYTAGKYTRPGFDYVKWMSGNKDPKAAFSQARASIVFDNFNQTTKTLTELAG